jgi:signal transduction histidine kinase
MPETRGRTVNRHTPIVSPEVWRAFRDYESAERVHNTKVGCVLVMTLMPAGIPMDFFVYPEKFWFFVTLRFWSAAVAAVIFASLFTEHGKRFRNLLGFLIPMVPVFFIAWMIAVTEGFASPYYAGLNLVLLAVGAVLRWTFREAVAAVSAGLAIYITTGFLSNKPVDAGNLANNFFFLLSMDVIVVTGTYFAYRQRLREFALRYELDQNREMLAENNRKLTEMDEIKSRFFANISHELRTPLTLLIAPLETLLNKYGRNFDDETRGLLATMQANGMRLLKLINDLLDLVRMESGVMQVRREPVPVAEFLKGLVSAARQVANDKRIRLEAKVADDVGTLMMDRDKVEKTILNLQFNALKFTPAGGTVELLASRDGGELVLQVRDTGMGIAAKNLPHVFDRFWQADGSSKRKYQGVGIGLALVKELTEIQGGRVSVESEEGKGTTFTARLPWIEPDEAALAEQRAEQEKAQAAYTKAGKESGTVSSEEWLANLYRRAELFPGMASVQDAVKPVETCLRGTLPRALIADDEPDMLGFLKSQLSQHYQIIEAVDGQQAVEKAAQFLPDIILLDMMMPEKDGLQACREIRARTSTQTIPVILLTARADEETKLAALQAGANDFLAKPFSTTELHVRVKNLVESHQFQGTLAKQKRQLENTLEQLKETESELVQSEKLASLGRLSAGIIHEINNPLNFATTGLFALRNMAGQLPEGDRAEYAETLKDIEEGIRRVKTIVSDLRAFAHGGGASQDFDQVRARELVEQSLRFLSQEKGQTEIIVNVPDKLTLRANRNKLIQVLINLVQNSLDALKQKSFDAPEKPTIWIEGRTEGSRAFLVVRDNGSGIETKHMDKIFDPFFTTKDVGQGMGLGLSICYRIIQEHEGRVSVTSEKGKFCQFTLEFPNPEAAATHREAA